MMPPAPVRPTLRRLMIFDATVRLGSIGIAAGELGLSQPAATHALSKLDRDVGEALLHRGPQGSQPTPGGRVLHRRVQRMLQRIEAALHGLVPDGVPPQRIVRSLTDTHLRCHLAIAATGSFRAASLRLGIAEPSLHRGARSLEAMLSAPLYQRTTRGIGPSRAGERLAAEWRLAQGEIEQAIDELDASRGIAAGRLSIGCLPLMPKTVLARAVGELLRTHPASAISVKEGTHEGLMAGLRQGGIDLLLGALRSGPPAPGMRHRLLFPDPYLVVARRAHPLALSRPIGPAELAASSWVVPWHDTPRRVVLEALFAGLPRRPQAVVETSSLGMMAATLSESDCLGLLSRSQVEEQAALGTLSVLPVPVPAPLRSVGVIHRADWLPTRMQRRFIAVLAAQTRAARR